MKKILLSAVLLGLICSCSDDHLDLENTGLQMVDSLTEDIVCSKANEGDLIYVRDSAAVYYCIQEKWYRQDHKVAVDGEDGEDAIDGEGCSVKETKNDLGTVGYVITCGKEEVGTLWNGDAGEAGEDGKGCSIVEKKDGLVKVDCNGTEFSLYMAMCGGKSFDPRKSFCFNDSIYALCGSEKYDADYQFCFKDSVYGKCPTTEVFEFNDLGAFVTYDPTKKYCSQIQSYSELKDIEEECGSEKFDARTHFCYDDKIYELCGVSYYYPSSMFCDRRDTSMHTFQTIGSISWMLDDVEGHFEYEDDDAEDILVGRTATSEPVMQYVYNLNAAKEVCPEGWRLPTDKDIAALKKDSKNFESDLWMTKPGGSMTGFVKWKTLYDESCTGSSCDIIKDSTIEYWGQSGNWSYAYWLANGDFAEFSYDNDVKVLPLDSIKNYLDDSGTLKDDKLVYENQHRYVEYKNPADVAFNVRCVRDEK